MFGRKRHRSRAAGLSPEDAQVLREVVQLIDTQPADVPVGGGPPRHPPSVFAVVAHASGTSLMTTKQTLAAFSHVIEQEALADPGGAHLFGAFQQPQYYARSRGPWEELAARGRSAHVYAQFGALPAATDGPRFVGLAAEDPMRLEWAVVVDRPTGAMALTARERPDQEHLAERDRLFDSTWSTHPATVRRAASVCAAIAASHGTPGAGQLVDELAGPAPAGQIDVRLGERLLDRLLDALDR